MIATGKPDTQNRFSLRFEADFGPHDALFQRLFLWHSGNTLAALIGLAFASRPGLRLAPLKIGAQLRLEALCARVGRVLRRLVGQGR